MTRSGILRGIDQSLDRACIVKLDFGDVPSDVVDVEVLAVQCEDDPKLCVEASRKLTPDGKRVVRLR